MGTFMKPGTVVLVLAGRYSGRKAVIVKVPAPPGLCAFVSREWAGLAGQLEIQDLVWGHFSPSIAGRRVCECMRPFENDPK